MPWTERSTDSSRGMQSKWCLQMRNKSWSRPEGRSVMKWGWSTRDTMEKMKKKIWGAARNQKRGCTREIWKQNIKGRLVIESAYQYCPRTWTWIEWTELKFSSFWVMLLKLKKKKAIGSSPISSSPSSLFRNFPRAPGNIWPNGQGISTAMSNFIKVSCYQ